ncbi:hypothetical protein QFC20_006909 [Naganishia adeliensis]|uniref:Uncharacterized protein n=1 Tax=Naganishia adeliensis TaxID=92952 RepID=A0ACC2V5M8_9TREE|nr:hypothetical protein QFC20_006909 [Naganishia adeliensis]
MSDKSIQQGDSVMIAIDEDPLTDINTIVDFSPESDGTLMAAGVSVWSMPRSPYCGHWKGTFSLTVGSLNGIDTEKYILFEKKSDLYSVPQTWCNEDRAEDGGGSVWAMQAIKDLPGRRLAPVMYLKGFDNDPESAYQALESIWSRLKADSGGREPSSPPCFSDSIATGLEFSKDKFKAADDRAAVDAALRAFRRKFPAATSGGEVPMERRTLNRP